MKGTGPHTPPCSSQTDEGVGMPCPTWQARPTLTETLAVSTPGDPRPHSPALTKVGLQCLARAVAARGTVTHVRDARAVDMARAAKVTSVTRHRAQALGVTGYAAMSKVQC